MKTTEPQDPCRERGRIPKCSSCRNGDIDREADVFAHGTIIDDGQRRPFRGYLCHDHVDMLMDDGADLTELPEATR